MFPNKRKYILPLVLILVIAYMVISKKVVVDSEKE